MGLGPHARFRPLDRVARPGARPGASGVAVRDADEPVVGLLDLGVVRPVVPVAVARDDPGLASHVVPLDGADDGWLLRLR